MKPLTLMYKSGILYTTISMQKMISKLEEGLYNIHFQQRWMEAQTDPQAIVNESMSHRAIHKAMFEAAALIGASILQSLPFETFVRTKTWNIQSLNLLLDLLAAM
ncbi:hypothetical protein PTKIN_Ptkin12aG0062000 [Pterospermum kingtungense]